MHVGDLYKVKDEVWKEWCFRHQVFDLEVCTPQPITNLPSHPPYEGYVMLAFPFHWWKPEELEEVK